MSASPTNQPQSSLEPLIAAATMAASSHNTQPWLFEVDEDRVRILPDLRRRCPEVDPDDHHLYASLGCATENLILAAQANGWAPELEVQRSDGTHHCIDVRLHRCAAFADTLADAIPRRQCTRGPFESRAIANTDLQLLERAACGNGVFPILISDANRIATIADYVAQGNTAQLQNSRWRKELIEWIRFDEREARRTLDGLWSRVTGNPEVPRMFGKLALPLALTPRSQNGRDVPWTKGSAGVIVFVTETNDASHWIEAGRCYERFALQATALGIRNTFINQPIEVPPLREQFAAWLGLGAKRPSLVVRFGFGAEMPRSLRRPPTEVMVRGAAAYPARAQS